jgi:hypothetical protein
MSIPRIPVYKQTHIARAIRLIGTCRVAKSTGITCSLILKYCAALKKAACAEAETTLHHDQRAKMIRLDCTYSSGSVMPFVARAQSRCVFTASKMLSVPPEVVVPAPFGLLYMLRTIDTTSASILRIAGKTSGWRGLDTQ